MPCFQTCLDISYLAVSNSGLEPPSRNRVLALRTTLCYGTLFRAPEPAEWMSGT